jgi:hypothetical protein
VIIANELLHACRSITARILANAQRPSWPDYVGSQAADAVTLADAFDKLDARIQARGCVPDSWHPLLKRRSDPPPRKQ